MPDINGIPYVDSTDLVSGWPATSQSVAQEVSDQLASKADYPSGGSDGDALIKSGTTTAWGAAGGLVLITTETIGTTVSSVTLNGVFSSTYDAYKIIVTGGVASSSNAQLTMQLGTANTNYWWSGVGGNSVVGAFGLGSNTSTTSWTVGEINTNVIFGNIELQNPNLAKYTIFSSNTYNEANANGRRYDGYQASTTQFTAFTFATTTGTLTGGDIRVYGYRK